MKPNLTILLLLISFLSTHGQIVNVENSRLHSDTTGWMGGAGASVNLNKNAVQVLGINLESQVQYKAPSQKSIWLLLGNYSFLKAGKDKLVSQGFVHLRYNYKVNNWLRWEVFGQYQNNPVLFIDHRFLLGTGPRFRLYRQNKTRLYAASLLMLEDEKELTNPVFKHTDLRNSSYVSLSLIPNGQLELVNTFFYQPLLKDFSDYRFLNQLSVKVKAGKHISLGVKFNYLNDSKPAGTAPSTTYTLATGFDYDF
jgi:hypothetical protein